MLALIRWLLSSTPDPSENRPMVPAYQTRATPKPDRTDHIWFRHGTGFKCCLCGALAKKPPVYPTPADWTPDRFDLPLTDEERQLVPYTGSPSR